MIRASRTLVTLVLSLLGGTLFAAIGSPLPWLLGPMAFVFVGARLLRNGARPAWPGSLRNAALIAIGYSIGLSFTRETLTRMGEQLPTMVLMTAALLLFCGALAYGIARLSGLPLPTVLMGCVPGGLSQMLVLAEDTRGVDLTVVTFLQVSRLMMIVFFVPMLVFSPLFAGDAPRDGARDRGRPGAAIARTTEPRKQSLRRKSPRDRAKAFLGMAKVLKPSR